MNNEEPEVILDFSTLEEKIEMPDLKDDPEDTLDLSEVVSEVQETMGDDNE